MLSDISFEQANLGDAEEILALQKLAYQSEAALYNDYAIPPLTQSLDEMRADFQKQVVFKACLDGQITGSVRGYVKNNTGYIGRLIVHPAFQGRGIGTRLMKEIEGYFGQVNRYEIFTGDRSERNVSLYQKLGYRIFRTERLTDKVTLVYMEKKGQDD